MTLPAHVAPGPMIETDRIGAVMDPTYTPACPACGDPDWTLYAVGLAVVVICPTCDSRECDPYAARCAWCGDAHPCEC